ncbi:unnamed protein product [Polarella glacialis]|uniref:Uncharacterized protein n=1 Tax=Polarella glacialis TaxID=89957 RepID=A0A813E2W8_POLGL|nr:unnamed protein product [Polarella glacialis]CAE8743465.1 unnamed protein product [Polarella glacialis]
MAGLGRWALAAVLLSDLVVASGSAAELLGPGALQEALAAEEDGQCSQRAPRGKCPEENRRPEGVSWLQRQARQVPKGSPRQLITSKSIIAADALQDADADARIGQALSQAAHRKVTRNSTQLSEVSSQAVSNESLQAGFCDLNTGGSCSFFSCSASRGQTDCQGGYCLCKPGTCAVDGTCVQPGMVSQQYCPRLTGGTCQMTGICFQYRGPTQCVGGQCLCVSGYCSNGQGGCVKQMDAFHAQVVPVNSNQPKFPSSQGNLMTGLCFSGGGSRSLSATFGSLRALESLGLMAGVDAISSVSGGTWASAIYMFANRSKEVLLGAPTEPSKLSLEVLSQQPAALGAVATTSVVGFIMSGLQNLQSSQNPRELWIDTYAKAVLEPFGLGSRNQYMAGNAESLEQILLRNPQLKQSDFLVPQPGRPRAFIMGGTLLAPQGYPASETNAVSLQMSPDFTGSPFYPGNRLATYDATLPSQLIGGGFVQSFAFGGSGPISAEEQQGGDDVKMEAPATPMSLARAVGISSAAFATVVVDMVGAFSWATSLGFQARNFIPVADYWPVTAKMTGGEKVPAQRHEVGDGAEVDNTGVMALLQRRVPRVVMFLNSNVQLSKDIDFCKGDVYSMDLKGKVSNDLMDKFGKVYEGAGEYLQYNQVFRAQELPGLLCEFQAQRLAGKPLVVSKQLEVAQNGKWGIEGGWTVTMAFVYLGSCSGFENQLPQQTRQEIAKGGSGAFANFPHFATVHQNGNSFTSYTSSQVNLLASLAEYTVRENAELFRQILA